MALNTPLQTFDHARFYSMIDRDDPAEVPDLFATNIENWLIRNVGELEMRDGLTAQGTSPSKTNLGSGFLAKANGLKHLVRVVNGAANTSKFQYSDNGTTWSDISGGGSLLTDTPWEMVQANDALYAVSEGQTSRKYDGSTVSTVAGIPTSIAIEWWNNRLWVLESSVKDKLSFSGANTPETFGGSDFVYVNLGDGSPGIGLRGQANARLFIGKERSVFYLVGDTSSEFTVRNLTYEHGVASHASMINVKNDVWCIDQEGNVRSLYRSSEDSLFSRIQSADIQYTISGLNKSALYKSSAVFYNNYAMFFVPNGVDSYNSLVLVFDTLCNADKSGTPHGGWIKFTNWNISRATIFIQDQPALYLHDSRTGNGQTYTWSGTSDNGLDITAKYETKVYDHGVPERRKKWKFAWQFAPSIGAVNLRFYSSIDRMYYTLLKTISLAGAGDSEWDTAVWDTDTWSGSGSVREKIKFTDGGGTNHGYSNQVKLEAQSNSTKIKIRKFTMHYRVFGLR